MNKSHRRRQRQVAARAKNHTRDSLTHIADQLNQDLHCGWCGFPARPYGGLDVESNAVWVHHLPGLPPPWQCAVHTDCLPDFQRALDANELDGPQRLGRYCVDGSNDPGNPW